MNEGYKISRLTMAWISVFLVFMCFVLTYKFTTDSWRAELVKRGHAKWVVKDEKGAVQWEWVAPKGVEK